MHDLTARAARRLYEVSRDLYAPVLSAFADEWLQELSQRPACVALCLGRDGLTPFLAARTLLRTAPGRFRTLHPRRVQIAYISRLLARDAVADAPHAVLLDRYLRARGADSVAPLMLVDVGIHGSIQDCLKQIYPGRALCGRYLVLRRRDGDPHGADKRGFLAELDVPPPTALAVGESWPPSPGWGVGGTLCGGEPLFLRPQSVRVLEDLWNGVSEAVEGLQVSAAQGRVVALRRRMDRVLALAPGPAISPVEQIMLKRAALRGVVDGVAESVRSGRRRDESAAQALASWFLELDDPSPVDAYILRALLRTSGRNHIPDDAMDG